MKTSHSRIAEPQRPNSEQSQTGDAAFSQIDLVTVIGVLLVLVLLLTPALARTRVSDQALQCRNNLRQLMHGWRMYADDHNGILALPPNQGGIGAFDWVGGGLNYSPNNPDNTNINYLLKGPLGPYAKNPVVYKCPADLSQAIEGAAMLPRVRSFSMSQAFSWQDEGHLEDDKPGYYRHYVTYGDLVRPAPSNLWVMIDENPDSVNDGAFGVRMDPYGGTWQDGPGLLHEGGCSIGFADGHVEMKKWTDWRTLAMKLTYTSGFPYGWSQPNNPDIRWLQDRTTAPK